MGRGRAQRISLYCVAGIASLFAVGYDELRLSGFLYFFVVLPAVRIHPEILHRQELVPFAPKARNPPLSYQPLIDYIVANYTPDAEPLHGRRVWRRKGSDAAGVRR